nr:unnamed protein product [Digitaria exilis]
MAMRHLVTGQNSCAPDGASSSNPLNAFANALLGQSSKTQSIKELPGSVSVPSTSDFGTAAPLSTIPGSENEFKQDQRPLARGADFIRGGPANDWIESFRPPSLPEFGGADSQFAEFDQIYNNTGTTFGPPLDGPPQRVLSGVLHSFLASGRSGVPFQPVPVNTLLHSLDIDNRMRGPMHGQYPELEQYWNQSQSSMGPALMHNSADKWITEFGNQNNNPESWANSFEQQYGPNGWASEFEQHQSQMARGQMGGANMANLAAMEQSRMLAQTLASNNDPKFQLSQGADKWASEFSSERNQGALNDSWVDEFSKLNITDEWAEEFSGGFGESSADPWADEFQEQLSSFKQSSGASRGVYVFSEMNPYVGHPNPMQEGQELFRKGLLSEAVLALEAEVLKNPDNAEGWRLLGVTHAENDDDQQAIAAMMRAHEANPTNLEVLLALGVSHTNELDQGEALRYLYRWLQNHPKYGGLALPQSTDSPYGPDISDGYPVYMIVVRLFNEAAQMSPEDADVHIVLGVLYNLSRDYDKAIASFKTALQLKPQDYSLWNKLGATQANSIQSAEAILAYQKALDLKPNYVRAWANMGISYANQGLYEDSIRYYVRAVAMNPKADNAWQYLKISLSNASRGDMIPACDARNLDALQKEFPL